MPFTTVSIGESARLTIPCLLVLLASAQALAAADGCLTVSELRAKAEEAHRQHPNDLIRTLDALDQAVGVDARSGFGLQLPIHIDLGSGVSLRMTSPYRIFRASLLVALANKEPLTSVITLDHILLVFAPPDEGVVEIQKLVLERDGKQVIPRRDSIVAQARYPRGRRSLVGSLRFGCTTFAAGARVTATVALKDGTKLSHVFTEAELSSLR